MTQTAFTYGNALYDDLAATVFGAVGCPPVYTEEQKEAVRNCKTTEEIMELAAKEGFEMNEAQMEAVSGGGCGSGPWNPAQSCPERSTFR